MTLLLHSKEPRPEGSQGRTAAAHVCALACRPEAGDGGAGRDRTDDLKLAKLPLSQLSYGPILFGLKRRRLRPQPWLHAQKCAARIRACGSSSQSQISQGWSSMPKALLGRPAAAHVCAKAVRRMSHIMVGLGGLEPPTSRLSSARSNQLSYKPKLPRAAHDKTLKRFHARSSHGTRPIEERETKTAVIPHFRSDLTCDLKVFR